MIRLIKDERGSTSVLIVVMMIVLLAFGMAALTTSLASYKLSQKNAQFGIAYYELEEEATRIRFELLSLVEEEMKEVGYDSEHTSDIELRKAAAQGIYDGILDYASQHEGMVVEVGFDDLGDFEDLSVHEVAKITYQISIQELGNRKLDIKLSLALPKVEAFTPASEMVLVEKWSQWQEGMGEIEETFFEDPF